MQDFANDFLRDFSGSKCKIVDILIHPYKLVYRLMLRHDIKYGQNICVRHHEKGVLLFEV
jgi:hypothetical protein